MPTARAKISVPVTLYRCVKTYRPFRDCDPLVAVLDFAGGAALKAVSDYPQQHYAGIYLYLG